MEGRRHCLKALHDSENMKRVYLRQHVKRIFIEYIRIKSEELNECTKTGKIPSSSEKSHKFMNAILWFRTTLINSSLT
jgi:hypothetical protein